MFEVKRDRIDSAPAPDKGCTKYPFAQMDVGCYFDVPRDQGVSSTGRCKATNNLRTSACIYVSRKNPEWQFRVELLDANTVRCWRTK